MQDSEHTKLSQHTTSYYRHKDPAKNNHGITVYKRKKVHYNTYSQDARNYTRQSKTLVPLFHIASNISFRSKQPILLKKYTNIPEIMIPGQEQSKTTELNLKNSNLILAGYDNRTVRDYPLKSPNMDNLGTDRRLYDHNKLFNPGNQTKMKVYRCQIISKEESCCCSCNSDAMFEVMKSLYDCYKKKDCNRCNCILCGHLSQDLRVTGEVRPPAGPETVKEEEKKGPEEKTETSPPVETKTAATATATTPGDVKPVKVKKKATSTGTGVLTPLTGKTPDEKEQILRKQAMAGLPLPEAKTASEKKLIGKVRYELGLPPEPKAEEMREKYNKAADAGLMQPLEGKTPKEKEKIVQGLAEKGIPLPVGRTPSEKSLIAKATKVTGKPSSASEKMRKAKAAGLVTLPAGKSPEEKEKILRESGMQGMALPEGKTSSDKNLINKVRAELGLPPEPKTPEMREKHKKAAEAGLLRPLEGKNSKEKEKILRGLADMGIPLPIGRTPSEKALIAKIQKGAPAPSKPSSSEKMRKAKAAGLLATLEGKPPDQKEKILKELGMQGTPLPEGKTSSEKNLINKVRAELGLPPEPKTPEMKDKHKKAAEAGLLRPLEGKSLKEKEKILRGLAEMGIPLPHGRTPSEKELVNKIKTATSPATLATAEKMQKMYGPPSLPPKERAKLDLKSGKHVKEGKGPIDECICPLLTPESERGTKSIPSKVKALIDRTAGKIKGKGSADELARSTPESLKAKAMKGIPLPEGKTNSEKKLINKVRVELGLPPKPKTQEMKDKHKKAADAGLLRPLEGKTAKEKEKILQGLADMGIPLPVGRTPSEKALIAKLQKGTPTPSKAAASSEKLRKAKAAGLLTPLEGKPTEQKEKILKDLGMQGLPLPEGKTSSEKNLIKKVRADLGLPPEPKTSEMRIKHRKAADAGILRPLEGASAKNKEKILRGLAEMGIPLPQGRTPSEKALIEKIKTATSPATLATAEKMQKMYGPPSLPPKERAKLDSKTGKNIKEGKGPIDECICPLLTPESQRGPKSIPSKVKALLDRTAGKIKGKGSLDELGHLTPESLKAKAMKGIPLPDGKTDSEQKIIDKVRADLGLPPRPKTPEMQEKYKNAAVTGVLRPLEGKSPKEKEDILRGLMDMGIPLPVGRTPSEKALIAKIQKSAPTPKKSSKGEVKALDQKAAAVSKTTEILTSLKGKSAEEKEKIIRGMLDSGLPVPEGKTPSEKKLIAKVLKDKKGAGGGILPTLEGKTPAEKEKIVQGLAAAGLPLPEARTASDKNLIKKAKIEPAPKASKKKAGEGIEEFVKTTVCDQACGCDKKKIKFKHSYVKIRVTSPDISSFCPCPNECIPGVFVDKDGIKVTVGSAVGVSSYTSQSPRIRRHSEYDIENISTQVLFDHRKGKISKGINVNCLGPAVNDRYSYENQSSPDTRVRTSSKNYYNRFMYEDVFSKNEYSDSSDKSHFEVSDYSSLSNSINNIPAAKSYVSRYYKYFSSSENSSSSIYLITSETSLGLNSFSENTESSTIVIFTEDSTSIQGGRYNNSPEYWYTMPHDVSNYAIDDSESLRNVINYCTEDTTDCVSSILTDELSPTIKKDSRSYKTETDIITILSHTRQERKQYNETKNKNQPFSNKKN